MSHQRKSGRDSSRGRSPRDSQQYGMESPLASTPSNPSSSTSSDSNPSTLQFNPSFSPGSHFNPSQQPPNPHNSGCITTTYNPFNNMSGTNPHATYHGSGGNSPMTGNKIVKNLRQMGDKTKSKTRDILKRWQTMNNGQASEDSLAGTDDLSDLSGSTESGGCGGGSASSRNHKKNSWSVHVWSE